MMKKNQNGKKLILATLAMATLGVSATVIPVLNNYPVVAHAAKKHSKVNAASQATSLAAKITAMSVAASSDFTAFSNAKLTIDADYAQAKQAVQDSSNSMAAQNHFASAATYSQTVSNTAITASSANSEFANVAALAHDYQTKANNAADAGDHNTANANLKKAQANFKYAKGLLSTLYKLTHQAVAYANQTHGAFNSGSGNTDKDTPELSAAQSKLRKAEKKLKKAKSKKAKKAAQKLVKKAKQAVETAEQA